MKAVVIIPTYNERENIEALINAINELDRNLDVLVVDDNSPDKTSEVVLKIKESNEKVNILIREKKAGLGKAYIAGFNWALQNGYEWIIEMDADFSHRPQDLGAIVDRLGESDFFIGSRWVKGGGTRNWSWFRKLISLGGSLYSRLILGYPINDWTGGFNFWNRKVLENISLNNIKSEGYSFQIELKYRALRAGYKVIEHPIIFDERRAGQSKMSFKIVLEALFRVWTIRSI